MHRGADRRSLLVGRADASLLPTARELPVPTGTAATGAARGRSHRPWLGWLAPYREGDPRQCHARRQPAASHRSDGVGGDRGRTPLVAGGCCGAWAIRTTSTSSAAVPKAFATRRSRRASAGATALASGSSMSRRVIPTGSCSSSTRSRPRCCSTGTTERSASST